MASPSNGPLDSPISQPKLVASQPQQDQNTPKFVGQVQQHLGGEDQYPNQSQRISSSTSSGISQFEQEIGYPGPQMSRPPFPSPFIHPNMIHMMQQNHLHQQHILHQHHQQAYQHAQDQMAAKAGQEGDSHIPNESSLGEEISSFSQAPLSSFITGNQPVEEMHQPPLGRPLSMESPLLQQGSPHMPQHPSMFNLSGSLAPPGFDGEYGSPAIAQAHSHFMHMSRITPPPPGFGHFPMHPLPGQPFQTPFQQQQFFMHQQMLHQQQQQMQQLHQFQINSQQSFQNHDESNQHSQGEQNSSTSDGLDQSAKAQHDQIKNIESQINQLLFKGDSGDGPGWDSASNISKSPRPTSGLTVQEIEEAQVRNLQSQTRRISLNDPVSPPRSRSTTSNINRTNDENSNTSNKDGIDHLESKLSDVTNSRFQNPTTSESTALGQLQPAEKAPFSVKDIDFYSDRKYDPYRPSFQVFDQITRDAKILCQELNPKPEEETRKLALLRRLSEIANEVFGQAEVLPFGSSGNGLALANADMDVCVFLNLEQEAEEVSPVEFVERIGDRLEKDGEFENILQLKRARVPIVKLNHVNGIACDIGYQNDLAIWNTRLLRAYCRIDSRVRDVVVVIKKWAKCRKINNPYTGSLSSYAYVLLVIHILQRQGVLPNLQAIVPGNGKIPFWDCQGFNRYFFEDIPNLSRYWQPTPEAEKQSVGEILYEFFRYFASEFRYTTHVVSIRSGGLLTKEEKEWTKDHTQPHQQPQPTVSTDDAPQLDEQTQVDSKPVVKNRYLFCIEDPFELDHNVGRPVDRFSLFTIRGEFMRAAKILSKNGDGAITRLCYERETLTHQERNRNSSIDHGDDQSKERRSQFSEKHDASSTVSHSNRRGSGSRNSMSFPAGEDRHHHNDMRTRSKPQGQLENSNNAISGASSNDNGSKQRTGRRSFYKRTTIGSEPKQVNRA